MSRIGKKPVTIPAGVEVKVNGNVVSVKGPEGIADAGIAGRYRGRSGRRSEAGNPGAAQFLSCAPTAPSTGSTAH